MIQSLQSDEELVDQVKRGILAVDAPRPGPFQRGSAWIHARSRPKPPAGASGRRNLVAPVLYHVEVMPRRRKINTRAGRDAARERVRQLVGEHDDQVVMLIWGGRILGWSLRKIAAALEGSVAPPGRRAGYTAGAWTAAAVQRICRRHNIPTKARAEPPRWFLSHVRRYTESNP